ncbi:MAG: type IX secretion system protein PorQ [Ignavibacteriales bacterium]|nr:type IX secretion system protein PorQ [Ignavibacteriales bacterium]
MNRFCWSLIILTVPLLLFGQEKGTYDFLRLDMNARAAALNGSFVSMTDDPNLLFYNPAALTSLEYPRASVSFLKHLLDVNAGAISYAQSYEDWGTFAAGIRFIDYGSFDRTDESMNVFGTFGARELSFSVGWGYVVEENLSAGAALEGIYSSIAGYRSAAAAGGLGVFYRIPSEMISVGASLLHIGTQLNSYAETPEPLPLDLTVGITKRPEHLPVFLNLNFHKLNESHDSFLDRFTSFTVGAEFLMSESLRLRIGFDNEKKRELKLGTSAGLAGFSLGGGLLIGDYVFDYSFNSYGKIGALHRISLGMAFGDFR